MFFFFKQKTAYEMRISYWSSDVCSSDLIQLFTVINGFGLNTNGGKAKSDGFEFTATLKPTRGLVASLNGAYTHARLTTDTDPNVGGLAGDRLPFVPKFNWNANVDYSWNLGTETKAFVGASLRSLSKQRANFDAGLDRKSTRSELQSLMRISYAVF